MAARLRDPGALRFVFGLIRNCEQNDGIAHGEDGGDCRLVDTEHNRHAFVSPRKEIIGNAHGTNGVHDSFRMMRPEMEVCLPYPWVHSHGVCMDDGIG